MTRPNVASDFDASKYIPEPNSGCWLWLGALNKPGGYGRTKFNKKLTLAHIVYYKLAGGKIPVGCELDHFCNVPSCVNPAHLRPMSHKENTLRSKTSLLALNARKSACPKGHPYDAIWTGKRGSYRFCRTCNRKQSRSRREA